MLTQQQSDRQAFQTFLESQYQSLPEGASLGTWRAGGWKSWQQVGLPGKKERGFQTVPLRKLFSRSYEEVKQASPLQQELSPHLVPECAGAVAVFVNGSFCPELSSFGSLPKRVVAAPLSKAMRTYGTFLQNQWAQQEKEEGDSFALLNRALHGEGLFLYLPPQTIVETPLQILHMVTEEAASSLIFPRVTLIAGAGAECTLVSTFTSPAAGRFCVNQLTECVVEDNARVNYVQRIEHPSSEVWHFDGVRASLKRDSRFEMTTVTNGSESVRGDYRVQLLKEGGEAILNGVSNLKEKREAHFHLQVDHKAPHCRSSQLYKKVLNDRSRASFEGKIFVDPIAQKTDAFQLNSNLLLSDYAHAYSRPNLEIFADDVKASHGSTVGRLSDEHLFYFTSRGIPESAARALLVSSFCQEVLDLVPVPSLRRAIV